MKQRMVLNELLPLDYQGIILKNIVFHSQHIQLDTNLPGHNWSFLPVATRDFLQKYPLSQKRVSGKISSLFLPDNHNRSLY